MYFENDKTLFKEIKEKNKQMEGHPCSWSRGLNIVNMPMLTRVVHRINTISIKIPVGFFVDETDKLILKSIPKFEGLRIPKIISKMNNIGRLPLT